MYLTYLFLFKYRPKKKSLTLLIKELDNFILKIDATYVDEDKLDENGKPDYEKIAPVLFEFPTYSYVASGKIKRRY